jgi:hypothetical protein
MNYWFGYFSLLFLVGGGLITLLLYLHRKYPTHPNWVNLTLMIFALFIVFMGLEFYFKVFFTEPDSWDTLARSNWRQRYANPATYNSFGYRDVEWTTAKIAGKTKVMVVGDSFVFGDGIEKPQDRFPDRLAQKLGPDYAVFNLGRGGTNTKHHIEAVINYPYPPDILILSYCLNDIAGATLEQQWLKRPKNPQILPPLVPLVKNSYAFNFLYWRVSHLLATQQADTTWEWYLSIYNEPDSWWIYKQQLSTLIEGARAQKIPLLVVVFPSMDSPTESQVVTKRVIKFLAENKVPVLDVADLIQGIPTKELMVSSTDAHPSELVHSLVAEELYNRLVAGGLVK